MSKSSHDRLGELFLAASDLSGEERAQFLDTSCGEDLALRSTLDRMLDTLGDESKSLSHAATDLDLEAFESDEVLPIRIGPYAIIRRLDEGGMGVVYEARQTQPERSLALKVLRWVDDQTQIARFELEAEVLGWLQHPAIAHVYGAGSSPTPAGVRPWIAMELVEGETIDRHVQRLGLSQDDILRLIADVLDGVAHAHSKGVVHRDLKPANIIVDTSGCPKIIDFGVAQTEYSDGLTAHTRAGDIIGTVAYMAPEQVRADREAIGTRSDIYAVGALAYELIAGERAVVPRGTELTEAMRRVLDVEPARLESKASTPADAATIIHTAMAKEPERRYGTAEAFAEDIRRYLAHETIAARPPSALYQLRKLGRRHVGATIGLVAALVFLVAGATTSTALYLSQRETAKARNIALGEAKDATAEAERQLGLSSRAVTFYGSLIGGARPGKLGREVKLVDVIDGAMLVVPEQFRDAPELQARILYSFHLAHYNAGRWEESLGVVDQVIKLLETEVDESREFQSTVHQERSAVLSRLERTVEAEAAATRAMAAVENPTSNDEATRLANATERRAHVRMSLGDAVGASEDLEAAFAAVEAWTPPPGKRSSILQGLSQLALSRGNIEESVRRGKQALDAFVADGLQESPSYLNACVVVGLAQIQGGDTADGRKALLDAAEYERPINGPGELLGRILRGVAQSFYLEKNYEETVAQLRQAEESLGRAAQAPSQELAKILVDRACAQDKLGDRETAKTTFRSVQDALGDCSSEVCLLRLAQATDGLASLLGLDGDWEAARAASVEASEVLGRIQNQAWVAGVTKSFTERLAWIDKNLTTEGATATEQVVAPEEDDERDG